MNRTLLGMTAAVALALGGAWASAADQAAPPAPPAPAAGVQDFVFLGESRPVLIRLHVRVDGKTVQAAWDDFMQHLFTHLDVNGDGVLSKDEAERAPSVDQIHSGVPTTGFGGLGGMAGAPAGVKMDDLDTNKDGKVTLAELAAYYRSRGFAPFQFQVESKQANPFTAFLGGGRQEPSVAAVSQAIFKLLDTNHDGKLTREELAAAPAVLLRLDTDDDEMIVPRELASSTGQPAAMMGGMMKQGGPMGPAAAAKLREVVLLEASGKSSKPLVGKLLEHYGPPTEDVWSKKLSRKDLGLDEATFKALDTNADGVLDAKELEGFAQRTPDVELTIRLGTTQAGEPRLAGPKLGPLADRLTFLPGAALVDLGATRLELRGSDAERADRLGGLLRQQFVAQFKQADKDGNGYLDKKEADASNLFRGLFHVLDRDGSGKVYEKQLIAYLDQLRELQKRGRAGCVTLVLSDHSRGLFDLLDVNRDGRLSVREMRGAIKLLEQLGAAGKGFLTEADMPRSYLLTLRRGGAAQGGFDFTAALEDLYGGYDAAEVDYATAGPLWFQKMDRNRDGDVSRKEFLGTDEQFRQIDTDGDGLISLEEAVRFDALSRKKK